MPAQVVLSGGGRETSPSAKRCFIPVRVLLPLLFLLTAVRPVGAEGVVGVPPGGYTNTFDYKVGYGWSTTWRAGADRDSYDMDADVNANMNAANITGSLQYSSQNPPGPNDWPTWYSWISVGYLQTRPNTCRYSVLMASFTNNTGTNAGQIAISYSLAIVNGGSLSPEEDGKGTRVYYSLSGVPGTWVNIPSLNTTSSNFFTTTMSATIDLSWTNGTRLYLLWADDNNQYYMDAGNQIDNFSLRVTAALLGPPTIIYQWPSPGYLTSLSSIDVEFSKPVTNVDASDLLVNGVPATELVVGDDSNYTFTVPRLTNFGWVTVSWATNHGIVDLSPTPAAFDETDINSTWQYLLLNTNAPYWVSVWPGPGASLYRLTEIRVVFSEPVAGVDAGDLLINGVPAMGVTGSGASYTFTFSQPAYGAVAITWAPGHAIQDLASPPNDFQAMPWKYTLIPPPGVIRGPYLQNQSTNAVLIRWRSDAPTFSRVEYGLTLASRTNAVQYLTLTTNHIVVLSNLVPNTTCYYAIGGSADTMLVISNFFFTTAPVSAKPTRIWVIGDNRLNTYVPPYPLNPAAVAVKNALLEFNGSPLVDLSLNTGDIGGMNGTDAELQVGFFDTYREILRQSVLWVCLGNHEQLGPYDADFSLPTAGQCGGVPSNTNRYYSFNYGNIHIISLDSQNSDRTPTGPMYNWLQQDLANNHSDWLIAFWHAPPYSICQEHNSDTEIYMVDMRVNFVPLLEAYGVDLVLGGHNHVYERTYLMDSHYGTSDTFTSGMLKDGGDGREDGNGAYNKPALGPVPHAGAVYATVGDSGAMLYHLLSHPAIYYGESAFGSLVLDINSNRLDAAFLRDTGEIHDHFTIIKGPIVRPVRLSIAPAEAGLIVSWPATATNYVLEASSALGASANWQCITNGITSNGALNLYSFAPASQNPTLFFRLQSTTP